MNDALFEDYMQRVSDMHRDFARTFEGLPDEALDWVPGENMNSLCVLVVHTCGTARYWVGTMGAGDPTDRDRDAEFRAKGYTGEQLRALLDETEAFLRDALSRIKVEDMAKTRIRQKDQREFRVMWSVLHALEHTGLHLGHAEITRQLWDMRQV